MSVFNKEILKKACQEFSLWNKFRLFFKRSNINVDYGAGKDSTCKLTWKELDGKIFITKVEYIEHG